MASGQNIGGIIIPIYPTRGLGLTSVCFLRHHNTTAKARFGNENRIDTDRLRYITIMLWWSSVGCFLFISKVPHYLVSFQVFFIDKVVWITKMCLTISVVCRRMIDKISRSWLARGTGVSPIDTLLRGNHLHKKQSAGKKFALFMANKVV